MANSKNSEHSPLDAERAEGASAAQLAENAPDGALYLDAPASALRAVHRVQPDQLIGAQFSAQEVETSLEDGNLVLSFDGGGAIVLEGYLAALRDGSPPSLVFQDGTFYAPPNPDSWTWSGLTSISRTAVDAKVASGPTSYASDEAPEGLGGSRVYEDDFGAADNGDRATDLPFTGEPLGRGVASPAPLSGSSRVSPPTAAELPSQPVPAPTPLIEEPPANRPPNNLTLTNLSVDELPLIGLPVGFAFAQDPDAGDVLSYTLVDDAGGRFVIDAASGLITTALVLDFETTPSHAIIVRATDPDGESVESTFTITVNDVNEVAGTAGADILAGTAQTDLIDGLGGDDQIDAGDGNDILLGSTGRDTLNGEAGTDALFGEAENDTLDGGAGADQLFGGSGNDILHVDADDNVVDGGTGTDRVDVAGAAGVTLNMTASSIELAFGGAGDDVFVATGSTAGVREDGGGGNDALTGGDAADRLRGEGGDDTLSGGGGADLLEGGAGNDTLVGGGGADVFAINLSFGGGTFTAEGDDTISDLTAGDTLSFRGVIDDNGDTNIDLTDLDGHVTVASAGSTATLTFDGGGTVTLEALSGGPFASLADLTGAGYTLEGIA